MRLSIFVTAALSAAASAIPFTGEKQKRDAPPLPSTDSFYTVPSNISSYAPGAIINHRAPPSPIAAFATAPVNLAGSYQILYRTTDNLGNATATVLTVLVPNNADFSKVLSYQVAEDAPNINCAPSYALQQGSNSDSTSGTTLTQAELLLAEAALYQGWVVILPDHEGPKGAYLANTLAGQATLDGIRAALKSTSITGILSTAKFGLWGYSGGALASAWAVVLQPSYAPELKGVLAGAAFGGTVPNINTAIVTVNGTSSAGLIVAGIVGLAAQYPLIKDGLEAHVLPEYRAGFEAVGSTQCFGTTVDQYSGADVVNMVDDPSLWNDPVVQSVFSNNSLEFAPVAPAGIPMFVYKAVKDEVSPVAESDALIETWCNSGASVQYVRDSSASHSELALVGAPMALAWLEKLAAGKISATAACSTTTKSSMLLDIASITVLPTFLLDAILALVGGPVGPGLLG